MEAGNLDEGPNAWLGANSFEDRCISSFELLANRGEIATCTVINYSSKLRPRAQGEERRRINLRKFRRLADLGGIELRDIPLLPYEPGDIVRALRTVANGPRPDMPLRLAVDITCLTKIHAVMLAAHLARFAQDYPLPTFVYTLPGQYRSPRRIGSGGNAWSELMLCPMTVNPRNSLQDVAGLVLPGHEGDRLRFAFGGIQPENGVVIAADGVPDQTVADVTEASNAWLWEGLGPGAQGRWAKHIVPMGSNTALEAIIKQFGQSCEKRGQSIVLYPLGPKPLIFAAAFLCSAFYGERTWVAYPIPTGYDIDYTDGVGEGMIARVLP